MKRRAVIILLFLLLGAIVNVAVAWACALWSGLGKGIARVSLTVPAAWPAYLQQCGWPAPYATWRVADVGPGVTIIVTHGGDRDVTWDRSDLDAGKSNVTLYECCFGVPMRALEWRLYGAQGADAARLCRDAALAPGSRTGYACPSFIPTAEPSRHRCLPTAPIWPGFAINTLLYGVILWLLFAATGMVRRRRRIERGLCPRCTYDLRGALADGCPECGWKRREATE
jgi:hypothetical protein